MLGTGLGLNSSNYVDGDVYPNLQYVVHTETISFASSLSGVVEDSNADLTLTFGQTAPGSSNNDWLKGVYNSDVAVGFLNGIKIDDPFNNAFDFTQNNYLALSCDIFLETGFAVDPPDPNTPPTRVTIFQGGEQFFYTTAGAQEVAENTEVLEFGAAATGNQRYIQMVDSNPSETLNLVFNSSGDRPNSGDTFYIRNLRIIVASQDLGTDISDDLFT